MLSCQNQNKDERIMPSSGANSIGNSGVLINPTTSSNRSTPDGTTIDTNSHVHVTTSRILGYCAHCGLRITNLSEACYAMGYLYHNQCFVCCCCKRTLRGKLFYKDQDKIYCDEDYMYCGFQQTVEKCTACGHIITDTIQVALGKTYHPGCFRCCICTICLNDGQSFTIDASNQIYCMNDYYLAHNPNCAACGLVIMPENGSDEIKRVVALNKEFHINCYRCYDCKRLLGDETDKRCYPFESSDSKRPGQISQYLLCLNCHLQRIGAVPATLSSNTTITSTGPKTTAVTTTLNNSYPYYATGYSSNSIANNANKHSLNNQMNATTLPINNIYNTTNSITNNSSNNLARNLKHSNLIQNRYDFNSGGKQQQQPISNFKLFNYTPTTISSSNPNSPTYNVNIRISTDSSPTTSPTAAATSTATTNNNSNNGNSNNTLQNKFTYLNNEPDLKSSHSKRWLNSKSEN